MSRFDFLSKAIKYILLMLLAVIVLALGNKVVTERSCASCPGNGLCNGRTDCEKY